LIHQLILSTSAVKSTRKDIRIGMAIKNEVIAWDYLGEENSPMFLE
jgi:hypothetical protein